MVFHFLFKRNRKHPVTTSTIPPAPQWQDREVFADLRNANKLQNSLSLDSRTCPTGHNK